jgi:hypothetical protein
LSGLEVAARAALKRLGRVRHSSNVLYPRLQMPGAQDQKSLGLSGGVLLILGNTLNV